MSLLLQGTVQRGDFQLTLELNVAAGETLALVGPNGAGKSTCLQVLTGLLPLQQGSLRLGNVTLDQPNANIFVEPAARAVGYLPQEPLLFPHLDLRDNVAYGLRARGMPRAQARSRAEDWLRRLGLADFGERRPREVSGGQAQRAALARALATEPQLLLLDEPLSAVDASARQALRQDLRHHLAEFPGPTLIVTHDAVDAFALAQRMAIVEAGRLVQVGTPTQIGSQPRSQYVADLVGLNFLRGVVHDSVLHTESGFQVVVASTIEGPAIATIHPRAIALFPSRPAGSPRNVWPTRIASIDLAPSGHRVTLAEPLALVAEVTSGALEELHMRPGAEIWLALKATEVRVREG